jgi:Sulfatase
MKNSHTAKLSLLAASAIFVVSQMLASTAQAQTRKPPKQQPTPQTATAQTSSDRKPNILFIMGDDIGWMQPSIYHRGLMVGETPNIDRIGQEGAIFMDYVAMQSCTSGRCAFFTGCARD